MNKHDSLRAAIVAAFPVELQRNPERLAVFIDKGRIAARYGTDASPGALSFEYRYKLVAILTDFEGETDRLMTAVLAWLKTCQPERLLNHEKGNEAFQFEAIILDDRKADVEITVELEEAVDVTIDAEGGYLFGHRPEPAIDGGGAARLEQILAGGEDLFAPS